MQVGWYDQAISFLQTAVQMEPNNVEYRSTLNNVMSRNRTHINQGTGSDSTGCCDCSDCCNCCTTVMLQLYADNIKQIGENR